MLPNPLKKLTRRADETTAKLLKALKQAQDAARLEILQAAAKGGVAGDAEARERLYERIRREYQGLGKQMDEAMSGLVQNAGKTATQSVADAGLDVHFSKPRLDAVWGYISPPNTRSLSAVFTDQMTEQAIKRLRGAFIDTYRQASIEGWTANETSKRMRDAWDAVAHDEDTYRFTDKSGKKWENARYLQMLHRTTAMRVERDYTLDRMADAGIQHFRVAGSGGECDICKAWEGQILTSVKTKGSRLPTYADAVAAGMFHPNCVHLIEPMDPDWGDDAEEIERQQKIPRPLEFTREAMQARRDKIEMERYKAQGMTEADAKAEVTRSKLAEAIRTGVFDREVSESVSRGMDAAILAELSKTGVPRFQMVKKGEEPGWHRGKAGGVVRTSRVPTAAEINGIIAAAFPKPEKAAATKTAVGRYMDEIGAKKSSVALPEGKTNPRFSEGLAYQINCQRCVPAWEMRKRGYDVEALPRPVETDDLSRDTLLKVFAEGKPQRYGGKADIDAAMAEWGDGARAQITMVWKGKPPKGHTFAAERVGGKTRYFDPQTGRDASGDFVNISTKSKYSPWMNKFMRIDTLEPTERIKECCKPTAK